LYAHYTRQNTVIFLAARSCCTFQYHPSAFDELKLLQIRAKYDIIKSLKTLKSQSAPGAVFTKTFFFVTYKWAISGRVMFASKAEAYPSEAPLRYAPVLALKH
jgi:hypothetical protein